MTGRPTGLGPFPDDDPVLRALRRGLADEANAVQPSDEGLRQIRARIAGQGGSRAAGAAWRRFAPLASAAASLLIVGGAVIAVDESAGRHTPVGSPSPTSRTVTATSVAASHTSPPPSSGSSVPVYYLGRSGSTYRLFREFHQLPAGGSGSNASRVQAAVTQAMAQRPEDPDYLTPWSAGSAARTTLGSNLITIVLNQAAAGGTSMAGSSADAIALQQLIWTATAAAAAPAGTGPARVRIVAQGPTPERFGSIDLTRIFTRVTGPGAQDPRASVWIDSLGQDSRVGLGPLKVSGEGVGGPDAPSWTMLRGQVVVGTGKAVVTSASGGHLAVGARGAWTITVNLPTPGRYRLTVAVSSRIGSASDSSASDSKDLIAGP